GVESVAVSGPQNIQGPGDRPSRRKIFVCHPPAAKANARSNEEEPCARKIFAGLARKAYRRPIKDQDVETWIGFYRDGRRDKSFEGAIGMALEGLLVSPEFLFRMEREPANVVPGSVYRVSDLDLASRLSFFLWSSPPDDQLMNLAEQGKLKDG